MPDPISRLRKLQQGDDDPITRLRQLQQAETPDPISRLRALQSERQDQPPDPGLLGNLWGAGKQVVHGLGDMGLRQNLMWSNLASLGRNPMVAAALPPGARQISQVVGEAGQEAGQYWQDEMARYGRVTTPQTGWELGGRVAGNLLGEGAQILGAGGAIRRGLGLAEATAAKGASRLARLGTGAKNVGSEALAYAPIDVGMASMGPEYSVAGAASDWQWLAQNYPRIAEIAERAAENPLARAATEVGAGVVGDVALRGLGAMARRGRGARPKPDPSVRPREKPSRPTEAPSQKQIGPGAYQAPPVSPEPDYARYAHQVAEQSRRERQAMIESGQFLGTPSQARPRQIPGETGGPRLVGPIPEPGRPRPAEPFDVDEAIARASEELDEDLTQPVGNRPESYGHAGNVLEKIEAKQQPRRRDIEGELGTMGDLGPTTNDVRAAKQEEYERTFGDIPKELTDELHAIDAEMRDPQQHLTFDDIDDLMDLKDDVLRRIGEARTGRRTLKEQTSEPVRQEALFGKPERPGAPQQTSFDVEPARGLTQEMDNARSTVSALEGKIKNGQASEAERDMYMDALSMLRHEEGLSAEEVGLRSTGAGEIDEQVGELGLTSGYHKYKPDYEKLTPDELVQRYGKLHRAVGEAADPTVLAMDRATVSYNTYGEPIAGLKEAGWKAQGRHTQMKQRLDALRSVMQERGVPEPDISPYRDVGRSDVFHPENKDFVGRGGKRIRALGDDEIADEIRDTLTHNYREDPQWSERMALLYAEATRPGRDVDLSMLENSGFVDPAFGGAAMRTMGGAAVGGTVGATVSGEHKKRSALIGAGVGAGIGAGGALRALRENKVASRYAGDPDVQAVLNTIDRGEGNAIVRKLTETKERAGGLKGIARTARQKLSKSHQATELVMERLSGDKTKGRDLLAGARGFISSATEHLEDNLKPIIQRAKQVGIDDVRAYRKARRKLELLDLGYIDEAEKQIGISPEQARSVIAKYEGTEVESVAGELTGYYRDLVDMKRRHGVITDEQYADIIAKGEYYDPFVSAKADQPTSAGAAQKAPRGSKIRGMTEKGSKSKTVDTFEQAILDTMEAYSTTRRQDVANYLGELVRRNPEAAEGLGLEDVTESVPRAEGGRPVLSDDQVNVVVNGERRVYDLSENPELYDSWASMDPSVNHAALNAANAVRKFFQHSITATPAFMLGMGMKDYAFSMVQTPLRGGWRRLGGWSGAGAAAGALTEEDDRLKGALKGATAGALVPGATHMARHAMGVTAALNDIVGPTLTGSIIGGTAGGLSEEEGTGQFVNFLKGAAAGAGLGKTAGMMGLRGNKELYKEWLRQGGGQFGFYARNAEDAKGIMKMLERDGIKAEDVLSVRNGFEALQYLGRALETAPRFAHVKRALKDSGVDITDPKVYTDPKYADAWGDAVFRGRDLAIDHSVTGSDPGLRAYQKMVPFLKPTILGADKFARMLGDPKTYPVAVATIVAPTVALWTLNADNEEYHNQPGYAKRMYWHVPKPDGEGFQKIPKPFELGIFATIPELALDYLHDKDPEKLKQGLKGVWGQFGPGAFFGASPAGVPLPVGMQGVVEVATNKDWFRKSSIDPKPWANVDPSEQYDDRTSTIAYALGQKLNMSPAKIDHIIANIAPGMGEELNQLASRGMRLTGADPRGKPDVAWSGAFGRFHSSPTSITEPERQFRRLHDAAEKKRNTLEAMIEEGRMDEAERYAAEHRETLLSYEQLEGTKDAVDVAWDLRNEIYDSDAPMERKEEMLAKINDNLARMLRQARQEELDEQRRRER